MKATELRIGNWFYAMTIGGEWIESQVKDGKHLDVLDGCSIDEVKPIPLTEEWLERFGIMQNTWFEDGSYMIKEDRGFGWEMYVRNAVKTKRISFAYFKHVHQLQNLYFALTGEELTQNK